ncbi:MAG: hypothetical protein EYC70_14580 [Planctomycetota bacterium]|nr:MAG: hypothetical protein EYC70_14580 [Planctomycetota bacterium]
MTRFWKHLLLLVAPLCAAACGSPEVSGDAELGSGAGEGAAARPAGEDGAPAQEPTQEGVVEAARQQIEVREQKRQVMAREFVDQANDAFERGDYHTAALLYADAFQLDPGSRDARDGLRRSEAALGGEGWSVDSAEDQVLQQQMRLSRERIRVEGLVNEGDRAMAAGDFGRAVDSYKAAELALRVSPNVSGAGLDLELVSSKLNQALEALTSEEAAVRAAETAAAEAEAKAAEEARSTYFQQRIAILFEQADGQFHAGFYEKAVATLDQILELDPRNEEALELRAIANEAWHEKMERDTQGEFREQWKRTFEELRQLAVPPKSAIEYDVKRWQEEIDLRRPLDEISEVSSVDPAEQAIRQALDSTRIEPRFDNPIEEIVENLAAYTGVNFVVSRAVREDLDEDVKTIRLTSQRPLSVSQLLGTIEDLTSGQVKFVIRNGVVNVVTAAEASGDQVLRQYEVRDLVRKVQDFPSTEVNLSPSGGIDEIQEELPEKEATILTEDQLQETIQENIAPESWDQGNTIAIENGTLIVFAPPGVHEQIRNLLNDLRRASNIMIEVRVRFLKVEDDFLQDVGVDFRGLGDDSTGGVAGKGTDNVFDDFGADPGSPGAPGTIGTGNDAGMYFREASDDVNILSRTENLYDAGLGDDSVLTNSGGLALQWVYLDDTQLELILRAVEKSKRSEIVTEPKLMVFNTSRANLTVANQVSYVGDFDVEIAQAAAIADPIVRVAKDGVFLDVRPVVTADRRFAYIDVRPTVATLRRPIPTFQTSLGTGSPVTLQLPELEIQKIRTRILVPDGGTLLLGGLNVVDQQDLESGVPFLGQVPIVSFFFSRKGTFESYRKLIILLSARVIIPDEFEPAAAPETPF